MSYGVSGTFPTRYEHTTDSIQELLDYDGNIVKGIAYATSADGSAVVGSMSLPTGSAAFRWTAATGAVALDDLSGGFSGIARSVSADGSIAVGEDQVSPNREAVIWGANGDVASIRDLLVAEGLSAAVAGWKLNTAAAVSPDGRTIVGTGYDPTGNDSAWIATLSDTAPSHITIPEFAWDSVGGLDLGYSVSGNQTPAPTSIGVYWATGTTVDTVIGDLGHPLTLIPLPANLPVGTYGPRFIDPDVLGAPPASAKYLLAVADPGNALGTFSSANVSALPAQAGLAITKVTTSDARTISVDYKITAANINDQPLHFAVYRSVGSGSLSPAKPYGFATIAASDDLAIGTHTNVTLALHNYAGQPLGDLVPDPSHSYVIAVANYDRSIVENDGYLNDQGWFQKHLLGVISHGLQPPFSEPTWEAQMALTLKADGYESVYPFYWIAQSRTWSSGMAVKAGLKMAGDVQRMADRMGKHAGDVVDIHFIGHSRGSVVVTQALQALPTAQDPILRGGYMKLTLLDPHPASNSFGTNFDISLGWGAYIAGVVDAFQFAAKDPPIVIPSSARSVELFYQRSSASSFSFTSFESRLNLWGQTPNLFQNPNGTHVNVMNLTDLPDPILGVIGHTEVPLWYLKYVAATRRTLTYSTWMP